jgi:hypothetical protein
MSLPTLETRRAGRADGKVKDRPLRVEACGTRAHGSVTQRNP